MIPRFSLVSIPLCPPRSNKRSRSRGTVATRQTNIRRDVVRGGGDDDDDDIGGGHVLVVVRVVTRLFLDNAGLDVGNERFSRRTTRVCNLLLRS